MSSSPVIHDAASPRYLAPESRADSRSLESARPVVRTDHAHPAQSRDNPPRAQRLDNAAKTMGDEARVQVKINARQSRGYTSMYEPCIEPSTGTAGDTGGETAAAAAEEEEPFAPKLCLACNPDLAAGLGAAVEEGTPAPEP